MRLLIAVRSYDGYGGHPSFSLVPEFVLSDGDDFGSAISELEVTFHFRDPGPARKTLESLHEKFHRNRSTLPKVVFRRKRGKAAIDVASDLLEGNAWRRHPGVSLPLFAAAVAETLEAVRLLGSRLTRKDDFDLDALVAAFAAAQARLPGTEEQLTQIVGECKAKRAARIAAMSPWDLLDIEWSGFHPDARQLLDAPFFWESTNDFSPHGNDTGADLLADYQAWMKKMPAADPLDFFDNLIRKWGLAQDPIDQDHAAVLDEAAVALAFAELKMRGLCRPEVVELARNALHRQRREANAAVDWKHREERLKSLALLETKLE